LVRPISRPNQVQARVKGFGAGMEPPAGARLVDGWFQWRPARRKLRRATPAPPAIGGCAAMAAAKRYRKSSGIGSARTPQR